MSHDYWKYHRSEKKGFLAAIFGDFVSPILPANARCMAIQFTWWLLGVGYFISVSDGNCIFNFRETFEIFTLSYGTTSQCHIFKDFPLFHRRYRCRHLSHSTNLSTCNHHEVSPWQNRAPCSRKAPASHCRSDSDTLWILSLFRSMQRCLFPRFHLSSADRLARSSRRRRVVVHLRVRMHVVCCILAIPRK